MTKKEEQALLDRVAALEEKVNGMGKIFKPEAPKKPRKPNKDDEMRQWEEDHARPNSEAEEH